MRLTRDKECEMINKKHTMISAHVDVKTTDNFMLRVFCVGFTAKDAKQCKQTTYAQSHQVKEIRRVMTDKITKTVSSSDIQALVKNLIVDTMASDYKISQVNLSFGKCTYFKGESCQEAEI